MKLPAFLPGLLPALLAVHTAAFAQSPAPQAPASPAVDEPSTRWLFSETTKLDCTFMHVSTNGEAREYRPFDAVIEQTARRSWVDRGPTGGRGLPFVRTYDDVGHGLSTRNSQSKRTDEGHAVSTSVVIGKPVRFARPRPGDPQPRAPFRAELVRLEPRPADGAPAEDPSEDPPEDPMKPEWLAALDPVTGFPGLRPERGWDAVDTGSTWDVPAEGFASVLRPGGGIPSYFGVLEGGRDPDDIARYGGLAACRQSGPIRGTAKAELEGIETEGGKRLARLRLTYELETESDATAWMREQSEPFEMALIGQTASNAKITAKLDGTGVALWDLESDRAVEITLHARATMRESLDFSFTFRNASLAGDYIIEFAGTAEIELVVIE